MRSEANSLTTCGSVCLGQQAAGDGASRNVVYLILHLLTIRHFETEHRSDSYIYNTRRHHQNPETFCEKQLARRCISNASRHLVTHQYMPKW